MVRLRWISAIANTAIAGLVVSALSTFTIPAAYGQSHFTSCSSVTGDDATLVIPTSINLRIDGNSFASGDEIAVFTPGGVCAGAVYGPATTLASPSGATTPSRLTSLKA